MSTSPKKSQERAKHAFSKWEDVISEFNRGSEDARMKSRTSADGSYLPKGNCFIEGSFLYSYRASYFLAVITHKPDHAGPHHARITLDNGKQWYRAVRNTADGGWEALGNVD